MVKRGRRFRLVSPAVIVERRNYDPNQTKDCNGTEANAITKMPIYETTGFIVLASVAFGYWLLTAVAIGSMIYWYFLRERFKGKSEEEQGRSDSEEGDSRRNKEKSKRSRVSEKSSTAKHRRSTSQTNREKRTNDEDESSEEDAARKSRSKRKKKKKKKVKRRKHCVCM
ncbi:hypothetical protein Tcan_16843 [Toxocara canis]|uniref:Uncharacterized protein n=1 Tax=Toxocara canis TaxID=6265 RepID=A0A0B2UI78_TOXCA|nr:hypothetical protein Tcan_16843 [Toxocara canis]